MQLMSWSVGRLGSRFNLCFEPYLKRVRHSGVGRFLDSPIDLAVGITLPDGTERALPFTEQVQTFYNVEQFERPNSITYRAYSPEYRLRFEFNVHSVFYPQDERTCLMPGIYLEMRVNPANQVRWIAPKGETPKKVQLFLRINKPQAKQQTVAADDKYGARIDLEYDNTLTPRLTESNLEPPMPDDGRTVHLQDSIVSINKDARPNEQGDGLVLDMPVTDVGSGTKWRLVWATFTDDAVLQYEDANKTATGKFRYTKYWSNIDEVVADATVNRDDRLAHSRNFEKAIEQAPLRAAQRHLFNQSFQQFLSNTFWVDMTSTENPDDQWDWFSVWGGSNFFHSGLDVGYNLTMLYLSIWPQLLEKQFHEWASQLLPHPASGGSIVCRDMGRGTHIVRNNCKTGIPVEQNSNFLLMLQAYCHWQGDRQAAKTLAPIVHQLADYLVWVDTELSGFPAEGIVDPTDANAAVKQGAPRQTYIAIKRALALNAATDLLRLAGESEQAERYENIVHDVLPQIEDAAWLGDHYAVSVDPIGADIDRTMGEDRSASADMGGDHGYSIFNANGLLLPVMTGHPYLMQHSRIYQDLTNAIRETLGPYGCSHTEHETENVWISQNLWRDHLARYLGISGPAYAQGYWDMQVMSNTGTQSLGFVDTYIGSNLCFHPLGITSMGYLLSYPRLVVDRLAAGGARISINPDRNYAQRWPLLPLADWKAGKIPICVVECTPDGSRIMIENEMDPVVIHQESKGDAGMIG